MAQLFYHDTLGVSAGVYKFYFDTIPPLPIPPTQQTIYSNAKIKVTDIQKLIYSDAKIKVLDKQQSITSDAYITISIQQPIYSDAKIKVLDKQQTIYSNAKIKVTDIQNLIYSDAKIKVTGKQSFITSDARISVPYASKFIRNEYLYIIADTNPAKFIKIYLLNPTIYDIYEITGKTNGKAIILNHTTEYAYCSLNNGYVLKISLNNPSNQTLFYVGENKQVYSISTYPNYSTTFVADDQAGNSLFAIDEAIYIKINSDIRTLKQTIILIKSYFSTNKGLLINSDIRTLKQTILLINTDIRFNKYNYSEISNNPLSREDFHVYVDDVELGDDDLILSSIEIIHSADSKSTATFELARKHDDINNPVVINADNVVKIYIGTRLEFTGKIIKLNCDSQNEKINVSCKAEENIEIEKKVSTSLIDLPLTILNEDVHLYDILIGNIDIDCGNIKEETDYRGIRIYLGKQIIERVITHESWYNWAEELEGGTFKYEPNQTYFWFVSFDWYDLSGYKLFFPRAYIGSSLSGLSSDFYEIDSAYYKSQFIAEDIEQDLGYYLLGNAPYQDVSVKNGVKICRYRWVDKDDGLYSEIGHSYNYINYCKAVAAIEFSNMKTINDGFVKTSANIELTLDAYLYYNLQILNRINIINTTQPNCYKNNNGFPVGIKQISISSNTMKVTINLNNDKATSQLLELPVEPEETVAYSNQTYHKFDLSTQKEIEPFGEI